MENKEGLLKHVRADKVQNEKRKYIHKREFGMGRDEILKQCSGTRDPSSSPSVGARHAWVMATPAVWCRVLVATGAICHHPPF